MNSLDRTPKGIIIRYCLIFFRSGFIYKGIFDITVGNFEGWWRYDSRLLGICGNQGSLLLRFPPEKRIVMYRNCSGYGRRCCIRFEDYKTAFEQGFGWKYTPYRIHLSSAIFIANKFKPFDIHFNNIGHSA